MIFGGGKLKKKTYAFDDRTIRMLEELKKGLGKKETQIIKEAIEILYSTKKNERAVMNNVEDFLTNVKNIADMVMELSYRLGKCEEKLRILEERLRERG